MIAGVSHFGKGYLLDQLQSCNITSGIPQLIRLDKQMASLNLIGGEGKCGGGTSVITQNRILLPYCSSTDYNLNELVNSGSRDCIFKSKFLLKIDLYFVISCVFA